MSAPPEIVGTFNNLLGIATSLGVIVCTLFLVAAGFTYITSGGNPGQIERAKGAAMNAMIGFGIILSANVLSTMIQHAVVH